MFSFVAKLSELRIIIFVLENPEFSEQTYTHAANMKMYNGMISEIRFETKITDFI